MKESYENILMRDNPDLIKSAEALITLPDATTSELKTALKYVLRWAYDLSITVIATDEENREIKKKIKTLNQRARKFLKKNSPDLISEEDLKLFTKYQHRLRYEDQSFTPEEILTIMRVGAWRELTGGR